MASRFLILILALVSCENTTSTKRNSVDSVAVLVDTVDPAKTNNISPIKTNDTFYTVGNFLISGDKDLKFEVYPTRNRPVHIKRNGDTLYSDRDTTIITDNKNSIGNVYKKFSLKYSFSQFRVDKVFRGPFAKPNFKTDPPSREYRTMIGLACNTDSINFAGHYTIAEWGCGMECGSMAIVDRINGRVFYSPKYLPFDSVDGHWGIEFKKDSRMIVVNSYLLDDYPGYCFQNWRQIGVYEWKGNRFLKIE